MAKRIKPDTRRDWGFTFYPNKKNGEQVLVDKTVLEYILWGEELCPTTKRLHHQGYVRFPNAKSIRSTCKKLGGKVTITYPKKGGFKKNYEYCTKDGTNIFEWGRQPRQGSRSDLMEVAKMIDKGDPMSEIAYHYPGNFIRYGQGFYRYKELRMKPEIIPKKIYVVYGKGGNGKNHFCVIDKKAVELQWDGKHFGDYNYEETVYLDEFDKHRPDTWLLLKILDKWPTKIRVLYGWKTWRAKTIYLVGAKHPKYFIEDEYWHQFNRRITEYIRIEDFRKTLDKKVH
jgi:hypothetical protein